MESEKLQDRLYRIGDAIRWIWIVIAVILLIYSLL